MPIRQSLSYGDSIRMGKVEKQLNSPSVDNVLQLTNELNQFTQEPLAQIQAASIQGEINTQEPLAQLGEVSETLSAIYHCNISWIEENLQALSRSSHELGKPCNFT